MPKVPAVPSSLSWVVGSAGPNGPLWIRSGTIVRSSHGIVSLTSPHLKHILFIETFFVAEL